MNKINTSFEHAVDILIIGGGISGAALARDAAGRGLKVMLVERDDYSAGTSSGSSKLIHGGLLCLDHLNIRTTKNILKEREILLKNAPHLVRQDKFLIPAIKSRSRSTWKIKLGLKFYDFLANSRVFPKSKRLTQTDSEEFYHLRKEHLKSVYCYSDCHTKDNRLVIAQLLDARSKGADIRNRCEVTSIEKAENGFKVSLNDDKINRIVKARFIFNVTGPWVNTVNKRFAGRLESQKTRLIRSSHIAIAMPKPALTSTFVLQNSDGQALFAFPWNNGRYLVIGTTAVAHTGTPSQAACTVEEMAYLLAAYNTYFSHTKGLLRPIDILWHWAGIRSFVFDGTLTPSKLKQRTKILTEKSGNGAFMSVYGTELILHRQFAEKLITDLGRYGLNIERPWTRDAKLPGGQMTRDELTKIAEDGPESIPLSVRKRWAFLYGDYIENFFDTVYASSHSPKMITPAIAEIELKHAFEKEDARSASDFLYRRTELFIDLDADAKKSIQTWFDQAI
ncbi:MAG: glycerol-3-phosphate dehydrogenase [Pseudomonadota bacterium]